MKKEEGCCVDCHARQDLMELQEMKDDAPLSEALFARRGLKGTYRYMAGNAVLCLLFAVVLFLEMTRPYRYPGYWNN